MTYSDKGISHVGDVYIHTYGCDNIHDEFCFNGFYNQFKITIALYECLKINEYLGMEIRFPC